jgi:succinate-semialdehyde dehydrogenase/glutarate-semialdehyde dehydrogenase
MAEIVLPLQDKSLFKNHGYINGKWVNAKSGATFEVTDPASGKVIAIMPDMNKYDVEEAIKAAEAALPSFRKLTARERARLLHKWYLAIMDNLDDLATLITYENGKPLVESVSEVRYAADYIEWFSEEAPRIYGDTIAASKADHRIYTIKQPIGVCGLITPWNWPAGMVTRKIGPALAAGCTVVFKSPSETPLTSAAIVELGNRVGIPPGVINIVTAHANTKEVGATFTTNPTVKKVSFTGSTSVGKVLMKQSSDTIKKLSFELGGNAPFIVFADADLNLAVAGAAACKFRSSGQTCVCANRIYVQRPIYEAFAEAFTATVNKFKVGPGYIHGTTHGPLIHGRAVAKQVEQVEDAVKKGAKILTGGHKIPELGPNFFAPTVIRDMTSDMLLAHEETFG